MKRPARFLLIFGLFWSSLTLVFDAFCARALLGQWRSRGFAPTPGLVLSSEVTVHSGSEDTTYGASVRYRYRVGARDYESDRVRFGQMSESGGDWARRTVAAFPAGSACTVYYDAADPTAAVLQTGISGQELFFALFLAPFNVVMVLVCSGVILGWRGAPLAGGARITAQSDQLSVRFNSVSPAVASLVAFGGVAFAAIFALGFTGGFSPPLAPVAIAWGLALAAGLAAGAWWRRRRATEPADLVINAAQGSLTLLPAAVVAGITWKNWRAPTPDPAGPLVIPLEQICGVETRERITPHR